MSKQDALFLLVKSLSPGEKAVVRQIDQAGSGYLALFDLIARQSEYDERKLKKKLLGAGHDINFAYAKNYLSKHILRTLRELRGPASLDRSVQEIQILMERKVFSLAEKMLAKARQVAWEEERWAQFLELSGIELTLLLQSGGALDGAVERIRAINAERASARQHLQELGALEDLFALYRPLVKRKQVARNEWEASLARELSQSPLLASPPAGGPARAQRVRLQARLLAHAYLGEIAEAEHTLIALLQLWDSQPFLIADHPADYLNDLLRLGAVQLGKRDFPGAEHTLAGIQAVQQARGLHSAEHFDKYYRLLLGLAIDSGDGNRALSQWAVIREGLVLHQDTLTAVSRTTLLALMARLQFEQGSLSECRSLLEEILSTAEEGVREDIVGMARIMLVFVYAEKGDHELAESASKAARKYFQRRAELHAFERRILRHFEQLPAFAGTPGETEALRGLRQDLEQIFKDPREAQVLGIFNVMGWIDKRLQG